MTATVKTILACQNYFAMKREVERFQTKLERELVVAERREQTHGFKDMPSTLLIKRLLGRLE